MDQFDPLVLISSKLEGKLDKAAVNSNVLLSSFRLTNEDSRKTAAYQDPSNFPFYYYLGQELSPKNLLEIGFDLGLSSGCFLKSCKTVENFLTFQEQKEEYYSFRIPKKNIMSVYKGKFQHVLGNIGDLDISQFKWDLVLINNAYSYRDIRTILDFVWTNLNGHLVVNHLSEKDMKQGFVDFAKVKNRKFVTIPTRYQIGMVER